MVKKIVTTISIIAATLSTPLAAGSFYIGPGVTYEDLRASDFHYASILPSLHVGYGSWMREWIYLGLEGFATTKSIDISDSDTISATLKMSYNYGLSIMPMVNLDDVLYGFARIGYLRTKFPNLDAIHGAY